MGFWAGIDRKRGLAMSKSYIIGLVAETPIHVGVGQAAEAIDLPVAREKATFYPHVPGSGVKGAFRVWAKERLKTQLNELFGKDLVGKDAAAPDDGGDGAGTLIFGEARLALLPVRCTSDSFKLATCPKIISRLLQDMARLGVADRSAKAPVQPAEEACLGADKAGAWLGLEEREFKVAAGVDDKLIKVLARLAGGVMDETELARRVVILRDVDFQWFAQFGLPVAMRNKLDANKIVDGGALWSEETLPTDSVMWLALGERRDGAAKTLADKISGNGSYIQMGGNETVGQGWFRMVDSEAGQP
jgi:CRISPR-associated protein Cmr4